MAFRGGNENINRKGRPKGSTTKPRISDYLTEEDIDEIVAKARDMAKAGNEAMIKLLVEQKFGKAPQAMDLTSGGEKLPQPLFKLNEIFSNNSSTEDSKVE